MNRIDNLAKQKGKKLVIYLMAGDPSLQVTEKLMIKLGQEKVSLIELGIPFSDPVADGPSIQRAGERALKKDINIKSILAMVKRIRTKIETPVVFMTYYNLIYKYGNKKFVDDSLKAGVDGVIIPDLPFDEEADFYKYAVAKKFHIIYLAAPTNTEKRFKNIVDKTKGFVYYILLKGVTGARKKSEADLSKVKKIKRYSKKPVYAGFGISTPQQATAVSKHADGVIIGSSYVNLIEKYGKQQSKLLLETGKFVKRFKKAIG